MQIRRYIANLTICLASLWFGIFLIASSSYAAFEQVQFESLKNKTKISAYLMRPKGAGPFPAVVMLHGCGGMGYSGTVKSIYSSWAKLFVEDGMAALVVDSAGSRGLGPTCGRQPERRKMYRLRPFDAYGALAYLQTQSFIDPERIGLVGWSQGGGVTLLTIVDQSIARPNPKPPHDFAVSAIFYPALCNDRLQSRPFTKVAPNSWSTKIPLLVLQGGADNWTPPEPCVSFIDATRERGSPVSIIVFPGAYHSFDAPGLKRIELRRYKTVKGIIPIVKTDEIARNKAREELIAFLRTYLSP